MAIKTGKRVKEPIDNQEYLFNTHGRGIYKGRGLPQITQIDNISHETLTTHYIKHYDDYPQDATFTYDLVISKPIKFYTAPTIEIYYSLAGTRDIEIYINDILLTSVTGMTAGRYTYVYDQFIDTIMNTGEYFRVIVTNTGGSARTNVLSWWDGYETHLP